MRSSFASLTFVLCVSSCLAQVQHSINSLSFTAVAGGEAPQEQRIAVISTVLGQPVTFSVRGDGGSPGVIAPEWLLFGPRTLTTPSTVRVSIDPTGLTAGTKPTARLLLTTQAGIALGAPIPVNVDVVSGAAQLAITPDVVHFEAREGTPRYLEQDLVVRNTGPGGVQPLNASVKTATSWLTVSTSSPCDEECLVHVIADHGPTSAGVYTATVEVATAAGTREIPVSMYVARSGVTLALDRSAAGFEAREGQGLVESRSITVFNLGEVNAAWNVEKLAGGSWLSLETITGYSTPVKPEAIKFTVNAAGLTAGTHYGLLRVSSWQVSPLYLPVMLRVSATATVTPAISPAGLVFTSTPGVPSAAGASITISASSATPALYSASVQLESSMGWLSISPAGGSVSSATPATARVSVSPASLGPGIYEGRLNFWMSGFGIRSMNVTLVVSSGSGCVPSESAVTNLTLPDNFGVEVGDHIPMEARLLNSCGDAVTDGSVVVKFSNGDRPITLQHLGNGLYSGHWSPQHAAPFVTVTAYGVAPRLSRAGKSVQAGTVSAAEFSQPVLATDAILNNLNPKPGAPLAPGTVAQVYGSALATAVAQPQFVNGRLPSTYNGTTVWVGGMQAPLYYLSGGQLNVQIPYELAEQVPHQVLAEVNGAYTVAESILMAAAAPGVAAMPDGMVIAQHGNYQLVNATNPARPSETVVLYLVGMGQTSPTIGTGQKATVPPLRNVIHPPVITLDGARVQPSFTGLTPNFVGLYQINLPVPANARAGNLKLVISQEGIPANETFLVVH